MRIEKSYLLTVSVDKSVEDVREIGPSSRFSNLPVSLARVWQKELLISKQGVTAGLNPLYPKRVDWQVSYWTDRSDVHKMHVRPVGTRGAGRSSACARTKESLGLALEGIGSGVASDPAAGDR